MSTAYVWTLVFYMVTHQHTNQSGGPAVIDNISTLQECQRIAALVLERRGTYYARCIQIEKVKS